MGKGYDLVKQQVDSGKMIWEPECAKFLCYIRDVVHRDNENLRAGKGRRFSEKLMKYHTPEELDAMYAEFVIQSQEGV